MSVIKSCPPSFGGRHNTASYYEDVSRCIASMRGKFTLRAMCFHLSAQGYKTPSGLEFNRSRLANFIRTAAVAV